MLLDRFGRKSGSYSKLGCFQDGLNLFLFLYLKSSKLPLTLLSYTTMRIFFLKWPKPALQNIISLGVTTISMVCLLECNLIDAILNFRNIQKPAIRVPSTWNDVTDRVKVRRAELLVDVNLKLVSSFNMKYLTRWKSDQESRRLIRYIQCAPDFLSRAKSKSK